MVTPPHPREHRGRTATPHLRVARPSDDLERVAAMYRDGLGLEVLGRFEDHDGFDGVMLGRRGLDWHLELTSRRGQRAEPRPTDEDLLVLYLPDQPEWRAACDRMLAAGFEPVSSANPYWDRAGRTFRDPDGYRVVLQNAPWRESGT
jgi:catechol 2,3-dioxygenase-like lactoylglutathione lyase family enzyme